MTDTTTPLTVRFARLPRRGFLLGLSGLRVSGVACAVAVFVPSIFAAGAVGAAATAPVWAGLLALVFCRWNGSPAIEALPTLAHYGTRAATGQTRFIARLNRPASGGTIALPGEAARLRFIVDDASKVAMVHDPHAHTLTAVALLRHPSFVLSSADEQARRAAAWGRVLAGLATSATGCRLQVLELTLPDAGRGITGWWEQNRDAEGEPWCVAQYEDLMRTAAPASSTHRTLIALSLDLRHARHAIRTTGRSLDAGVRFLQQEMTSLAFGLREAEVQVVRWLGEDDLAKTLRTAYEPGFETQPAPHLDFAGAGPMAVQETWGHVRHDTAFSAVLWISEWPRVAVPTFFLHSLVFQPAIRKTLSLFLEPVPVETAMRDIRKAKVEYVTDAAQKAKLGTLSDLSDEAEHADVLDRERALLSGHADVRLTGLLTVTAPSLEELEAHVAEVSRAAIQSGCEVRRLYGRQARAFTAGALPLAREVN